MTFRPHGLVRCKKVRYFVTGLAADYATWRIREPNSDHFGDRTCIDLTRESVMEMHQVRYFLAVAQELNFSRAAEKCNVSQPSLSRAMQQLEGELGGPLFRRERHLTHLTELGAMVRPHLETLYEAALRTFRTITESQSAGRASD
jgi:Bacterial regulatory helix-turn-helix protein, lysR family